MGLVISKCNVGHKINNSVVQMTNVIGKLNNRKFINYTSLAAASIFGLLAICLYDQSLGISKGVFSRANALEKTLKINNFEAMCVNIEYLKREQFRENLESLESLEQSYALMTICTAAATIFLVIAFNNRN